MDLKKMLDNLLKNKKSFMYYMVIVVLCGVLLLLIGNVTSGLYTAEKSKDTKKNAIQVSTNAGMAGTPASYEDKLRKDLVEILGKIQGVGRVDVVVRFDEDYEEVPAKNINNTEEKIEEKDSQGGEQGYH